MITMATSPSNFGATVVDTAFEKVEVEHFVAVNQGHFNLSVWWFRKEFLFCNYVTLVSMVPQQKLHKLPCMDGCSYRSLVFH